MIEALVIAVPALPVACGLLVQIARSPTTADRINVAGALATAAAGLTLAIIALAQSATPTRGSWYVVDGATGAFLAVVAVIGLLSALVSPAYLAGAGRSFFRAARARAWYYLGLHLFWAVLLALPLVNNLGVAWLLVEASTGASALLVAYSGRRSALEAGWKYLVLTTFGLTIALVGILVLYVGLAPSGGVLATLNWQEIAAGARLAARGPGAAGVPADHRRAGDEDRLGPGAQLAARRAQRGSAARQRAALGRAAADRHPRRVARSGHARSRAGRRRGERDLHRVRPGLAGDGGAVPLAAARVEAAAGLLQPGAHGRAGARHRLRDAACDSGRGRCTSPDTRSRRRWASMPRCRCCAISPRRPSARRRASPGRARGPPPRWASAWARSAALPPSPLFFSEVLILFGGVTSGKLVVALIATALLGLGFLGLAHAMIGGLVGGKERQRAWRRGRTVRAAERLTAAIGVGLIALSAGAYLLPDSNLIRMLMAGVS